MAFSKELCTRAVTYVLAEYTIEQGLTESFTAICRYLSQNPDRLSWRGKDKPDLNTARGIAQLCTKYFRGYFKSDFPAIPGTVPDEMVSIVMQAAYGYSEEECGFIKLSHQQSMCAENAVGALLERYIDSVLRSDGWHWCCGDFVKAIDFIKENGTGWHELQIKNRDNSENSSSSAIRNSTNIQKWFRTFSRNANTNWHNLPAIMQNKGLSESGFKSFVIGYLSRRQS